MINAHIDLLTRLHRFSIHVHHAGSRTLDFQLAVINVVILLFLSMLRVKSCRVV